MAQAQRSDANDDGGGGGDRRPAPKTTTSRFFFTRKVTSRGASNVFQTSSLVPVRRIFSRSSRTDAGRRASDDERRERGQYSSSGVGISTLV